MHKIRMFSSVKNIKVYLISRLLVFAMRNMHEAPSKLITALIILSKNHDHVMADLHFQATDACAWFSLPSQTLHQ